MPKTTWYQKREGKAEHIVYLDKKAKELDKMLHHEKTMIIRGAAGKKIPLGGRVKSGDILYYVETGSSLLITHKAVVKDVFETEKMSEEESKMMVDTYQNKLQLSKEQLKRWAGKKCLCLIEVYPPEEIEPFSYIREKNMDDWIIVDDINHVKSV